jgi:hypothetical protein
VKSLAATERRLPRSIDLRRCRLGARGLGLGARLAARLGVQVCDDQLVDIGVSVHAFRLRWPPAFLRNLSTRAVPAGGSGEKGLPRSEVCPPASVGGDVIAWTEIGRVGDESGDHLRVIEGQLPEREWGADRGQE